MTDFKERIEEHVQVQRPLKRHVVVYQDDETYRTQNPKTERELRRAQRKGYYFDSGPEQSDQ